MKHLTNKRFAVDGDVKQAVTYWPQTLGTCVFYTRKQALVSNWNRYVNVKGDYMESDVYHLLNMYNVHIEFAVKFSVSKCPLSHFFLNSLCTLNIFPHILSVTNTGFWSPMLPSSRKNTKVFKDALVTLRTTLWILTFRCDIPVVFHKLNTKYI